MAKMTNEQLNVLSEGILIDVEEANQRKVQQIKRSKEYTEYEQSLEADPIIQMYNKAIKLEWKLGADIKEIEKRIEAAKVLCYDKVNEALGTDYQLDGPYYSRVGFQNLGEKYLAEMKTNKFGKELKFDKNKMLTIIKRELLLGDLKDLNSLVDQVKEKLV